MMNRKEAVSYLETMKIVPSENWNELWKEAVEKRNQVIDIAIEVLLTDSEKPCKTCGYYKFECPQDCEYNRPLTNTAQGEWEPLCADIPKTCSVCGEDWDKYMYGSEVWYTGELPKFCPNCGVRMKAR